MCVYSNLQNWCSWRDVALQLVGNPTITTGFTWWLPFVFSTKYKKETYSESQCILISVTITSKNKQTQFLLLLFAFHVSVSACGESLSKMSSCCNNFQVTENPDPAIILNPFPPESEFKNDVSKSCHGWQKQDTHWLLEILQVYH